MTGNDIAVLTTSHDEAFPFCKRELFMSPNGTLQPRHSDATPLDRVSEPEEENDRLRRPERGNDRPLFNRNWTRKSRAGW